MNWLLLHSDRAENSIMQTISIAISAILIAAGLVTAPGLINNARDNNAKTDLANIAYGQEFKLSTDGKYAPYINDIDEARLTGAPAAGNNLATILPADGMKFSLSGKVTGHEARVCDNPDFFVLKAQSSSKKWFYRGSDSGLTSANLSDIVIPAEVLSNCPDIIDGFEGGTTVIPPTVPNPYAEQCTDPNAEWAFADPDVKQYVINNVEYNTGVIPSPLRVSDAAGVTSINLNNSIYEDLDGLQCATNMTGFYTYQASVSDFSVLNNFTLLQNFSISQSLVNVSVDIDGLSNLSYFSVQDSQGADIAVSNLGQLTYLSIGNNGAVELEIEDMPALRNLVVSHNAAVGNLALDGSNPVLRSVTIEDNQSVGNLTISDNTVMDNLAVRRNVNSIGNVSIANSFNPAESYSYLSIEWSGAMGDFTLVNVPAAYVYLQHTPVVGEINIDSSVTNRLDVSDNGTISSVNIHDSNVGYVSVDSNDSVGNITANNLPNITNISSSNASAPSGTTLSISAVPLMTNLQMRTPGVTSIALSGATSLSSVDIEGASNITSFGFLSGVTTLTYVNLTNSGITSLNNLVSFANLNSVSVGESFSTVALSSFESARPDVYINVNPY